MNLDSIGTDVGRPRHRRATFACALIAGLAVACSSDDDDGGGGPPVPTFEPFVLQLFDGTDPAAEPTPINDIEFTFGNDPAAFDSLLD